MKTYLDYNIKQFFQCIGRAECNISLDDYANLYRLYDKVFGLSQSPRAEKEFERAILCMWINRFQYGSVNKELKEKVACVIPYRINTLYKYSVELRYSVDDDCFYGRLLVKDLIVFEGETYQEVMKQIPDVIEDYEATLRKLGRSGDMEDVGERESGNTDYRENKSVLQIEFERIRKQRNVFTKIMGNDRAIRAVKKVGTIILIIALFIFIGWLIPIKSPFEQGEQIKHKVPTRVAPPPKKEIIYEDLNEDGEPEFYQVIPLFEVQE